MGFWRRRSDGATIDAPAVEARAVRTTPDKLIPTWDEFQGMRTLWAMMVPAYRRGHNLIAGKVATMPIRHDQSLPDNLRTLAIQPERDRGYWVTMNRTVGDLVNRGRAYWLIETPITAYRVKWLPADEVSEQDNGRILYAGTELFRSDPNDRPIAGRVIAFDGYREGALDAGGDVLATALALELASRDYAETPHPGDVLENTSGAEMDDEDVKKLIRDWRDARKAQAGVAYLAPGVKLGDPKGWSPTELALDVQRNQSAVQIARLLNMDAAWVSASVGGTAMTYVNRIDLRQDFYDLTLTDYVDPIAQRLSMRDVFDRPTRLDPAAFLRANLQARVEMATALLAAEVIDRAEARAFVSDATIKGPVT